MITTTARSQKQTHTQSGSWGHYAAGVSITLGRITVSMG